jgi:hypothetical protein
MKPGGLAIILGKGPPPKGGGPMPDAAPAPDDESSEGGDEKEYAKLVISAIKDGDDAGAADALVSMMKACK